MSTISSISSTSSAASAAAFDPAKGATRIAAKVFGEMDGDQDGKVSKSEFVTSLQSKGVSDTDATKQYDAIDTQKNGSITQSDLENAVKSGTFGPPAGQKAGGSPPAGGARPEGGGGGGAGAASSTSSTITYEAADSNKDGTVSDQEQLVYSISHPSAEATTSSATSTDPSKIGTNVDQLA
ncbi:MAG: EF-hand domain-containing protein [Sphingomonadaceae bacterium]